jgi:pyruvate/2-oxoacid:ferredoxin oxidoreductase alpha subunit
MLRIKTAWPFPIKGFEALPDTVKRFVTVETNLQGQMLEDVLMTTKKVKRFNQTPVYALYTTYLVTSGELRAFMDKVASGEAREV